MTEVVIGIPSLETAGIQQFKEVNKKRCGVWVYPVPGMDLSININTAAQ